MSAATMTTSPAARLNVLDHGFVRLVDSMGSDLSVVRAARVSHDAAWRAGQNQGSDERLIRYLWKHAQTTPFEAVTFTFEVKAPIFVFRQWHRHRTWSFSELSARYRELPAEFYLPTPETLGVQSAINKQGRDLDAVSQVWAASQIERMREQNASAFETYHALLAMDVPREIARSVLPVSTYSHMFATVDLLNLFRFLTLRCDEHAQYEIRVYADAMLSLIEPVVPVCAAAWQEARPRFPAPGTAR